MGYRLEGRLLEVCDCNILCPCWVGEDPDPGTCQAVQAYRIDRGTIDGVDVAGLTVAEMDDIPGNILKGNIRGVSRCNRREQRVERPFLAWSEVDEAHTKP